MAKEYLEMLQNLHYTHLHSTKILNDSLTEKASTKQQDVTPVLDAIFPIHKFWNWLISPTYPRTGKVQRCPDV